MAKRHRNRRQTLAQRTQLNGHELERFQLLLNRADAELRPAKPLRPKRSAMLNALELVAELRRAQQLHASLVAVAHATRSGRRTMGRDVGRSAVALWELEARVDEALEAVGVLS